MLQLVMHHLIKHVKCILLGYCFKEYLGYVIFGVNILGYGISALSYTFKNLTQKGLFLWYRRKEETKKQKQ